MRTPFAIRASDVAERVKKSNYPSPFAERMDGRAKRSLGDLFGLTNFGVNLTTLAPGAVSALQHAHTLQDEFVYILEGEGVLVCGEEETIVQAGMCAGFRAGGVSHHLENRGETPVVYLEIGDRTPGDKVSYPQDDLIGESVSGGWQFRHKDGTPY